MWLSQEWVPSTSLKLPTCSICENDASCASDARPESFVAYIRLADSGMILADLEAECRAEAIGRLVADSIQYRSMMSFRPVVEVVALAAVAGTAVADHLRPEPAELVHMSWAEDSAAKAGLAHTHCSWAAGIEVAVAVAVAYCTCCEMNNMTC